MTDLARLIAQCRDRDPRAQSLLFDLFKKRWMGICVRYIKDEDEAKDVFQEAAIKIFEGVDSLTRDEAFDGWARRIMINHSLNYLRKKKVYVLLMKEYSEDHSDAVAISADVMEKMNSAEVLGLINQLPEGYRLVLNLAIVDGYKHLEIAKLLSITESTSRSQLNKARKFLQRLIEEQKIKEDARITG